MFRSRSGSCPPSCRWASCMERRKASIVYQAEARMPWPKASRSDSGRAGRQVGGGPVDLQTTATFTQWIGGRASNRQSHRSPPSLPIHSWPVVVPKYSAGVFSSSMSIASRWTVK